MENTTPSAAKNGYPLVSVIIPTYNRAKYLRQCLESALSQDYPNFEVIVVDNGSTDNTPEILASFGNKIRCQKEEKKGPGAARNKGIEASRGEFIAFLDSDDYYLPGKISLSAGRLMEDHSVALVYADCLQLRIKRSRILTEEIRFSCPNQEEFTRRLLSKNYICGSNVMVRKECLEKVSGFRPELPVSEDSDLWFRLLKAGYHFGHIPETLFVFRTLSNNYRRKEKSPHPFYRDKVHSEALGNFTAQELFGDLLRKNDWKGVKSGYEEIARKLYKRRLLDAALIALEKAAAVKESSPRLSLSMLILKTKITFQKQRRRRALLIRNT